MKMKTKNTHEKIDLFTVMSLIYGGKELPYDIHIVIATKQVAKYNQYII